MKNIPNNSALLIIDVQKGFDDAYWGTRNNPQAESNIETLLKQWRSLSMPVVHIQHVSIEPDSPLRPGQPGNDFKSEVFPLSHEHVEQKTVNSGFIGTTLEEHLRERKVETVILVGLTTDHCVSTTTRMAGNLGFNAIVIADAVATFERTGYDGTHFSADEIHGSALASLHNEFATVVTTAEILEALTPRSLST